MCFFFISQYKFDDMRLTDGIDGNSFRIQRADMAGGNGGQFILMVLDCTTHDKSIKQSREHGVTMQISLRCRTPITKRKKECNYET